MIFQVIKVIHICAIISWMAALLYLPRLFYYHASKMLEPSIADVFSVMEQRLNSIIMRPAAVATFLSGFILAVQMNVLLETWFLWKILFVLGLVIFQGFCEFWRLQLKKGILPFRPNFFRILNEVPTVFMISIVFLVIFK